MVIFLARSALCIGIVAGAASGVGAGRFAAAVDRGARDALGGAGRACLATSECLRAGTAALSGIARTPGMRPAVPAGRGADAKPLRAPAAARG